MQISLVIYRRPLLCTRMPPGATHFLRLPLVLRAWRVRRRAGHVFCRMSHRWHLSDVLLIIRLGVRHLGRKTTR